jgi:hypothetical protein
MAVNVVTAQKAGRKIESESLEKIAVTLAEVKEGATPFVAGCTAGLNAYSRSWSEP